MKNTSKLLSLFIIVVFVVSACRKESANPGPGPDFRDSLVGNYNCLIHYHTFDLLPYPGVSTDTIIGSNILNISKSPTNESAIVIGSTTFTRFSQDSMQVGYSSPSFYVSAVPNLVFFVFHNDSFCLITPISQSIDFSVYYYAAGFKQ